MSEITNWRSLGFVAPRSLLILGNAGSMASIDRAVNAIIMEMMMMNSAEVDSVLDFVATKSISLCASKIFTFTLWLYCKNPFHRDTCTALRLAQCR